MKRILIIAIACSILITCTACIQIPTAQTPKENYSINPSVNDNIEHNYTNSDDQTNELEEAESYCERLVAQGDTLTAYNYIKEKAKKDYTYNSLLQKYTQIYVDDTLKTAKNYADKESYEQAVYILKEAKKVYECNEFELKIEEYESNLPCQLAFCHRIDEEDYKYMLEAEDCFGNQYKEVFGFNDSFGGEAGGYAVFYLNGKYNHLTGIFVGSKDLYKDMEVDCRIYADGKLIYESPKLGRTSSPVNINLDVTGVEQLRVEYMYYTWWTHDPCCIFDLTAYK